MSRNVIQADNCPTYMVECGNDHGNAFLLQDNTLLTVRHVVKNAIRSNKDIIVCDGTRRIKCEIIPPKQVPISSATVIVLKPQGKESSLILKEGLSIHLFSEDNQCNPHAIGYMKDELITREFSAFERRRTTDDPPGEEKRNYWFNPNSEPIENFEQMSGSPIFIRDGFFGLINFQKSYNGKSDRLTGFCDVDFFKELEKEYGIEVRSEGNRKIVFSQDEPMVCDFVEESDSSLQYFPDQFAKDCYDSYGDAYTAHWCAQKENYPCLKKFDRFMEKALMSSDSQKLNLDQAIQYLLSPDFLSANVDGVSREKRAGWILGAKYWQMYADATPESKANLLGLLSVKPSDIPDIPQRHLILGIMWFSIPAECKNAQNSGGIDVPVPINATDFSEEITFAEEALNNAHMLCKNEWENTNCHADVHSFLGSIRLTFYKDQDSASIHFFETETYCADKTRLAENHRRTAMRYTECNLYIDALKKLKIAIELENNEPKSIKGLNASYSRVLKVCCYGLDSDCSEETRNEYKTYAINAINGYRDVKRKLVPEEDSEPSAEYYANELLTKYVQFLCKAGLFGQNLKKIRTFGMSLGVSDSDFFRILFKQIFPWIMRESGLSGMPDEITQQRIQDIINELIHETFEEQEAIHMVALLAALLDIHKEISFTSRWTEALLVERLSLVYSVSDPNAVIYGYQVVRKKHPALLATIKEETAIKDFLCLCSEQEISLLICLVPITTSEYELFRESWKIRRDMLFQCKFCGFDRLKQPLQDKPWLDEPRIRVSPCIYRSSEGKTVYVMYLFCHTR